MKKKLLVLLITASSMLMPNLVSAVAVDCDSRCEQWMEDALGGVGFP
jgi:hypothetical protein